jgi:hypothetical protein
MPNAWGNAWDMTKGGRYFPIDEQGGTLRAESHNYSGSINYNGED